MTRTSERRTRLVVNRPLQSRIVLSVSWPFVVSLVVCAAAVGWFCIDLTEEVMEADVDLPSLVPFFFTVMALMVVSAAFLLFHLYRFSHRIAGPMVNIKRSLQAVQDGRLGTRIKLRKHDLLMDAADHINEFLDWLEQHPPAGVEADPQPAEVAMEPVGAVAGETDPGSVS